MGDQISNLQEYADSHMKKCVISFRENINKIHIGRISPDILDGIQVEYYGVLTPLLQLTNSVVENLHTLVITVFDKKMIKSVEKAILNSDLGLNSVLSENVLRVMLPCLTEERRLHLVKIIRIEAEKSKVSIRNIRRYIKDKIKILSKNKEINTDKEHFFQDKIQKLTDFWIKEIDVFLKKKELELMKF